VKSQLIQGDEIEVPLIEIAHARSGDKGNHSNIGVIARKAEYLPWIRAALLKQCFRLYAACFRSRKIKGHSL
jgi:hypothetical protein